MTGTEAWEFNTLSTEKVQDCFLTHYIHDRTMIRGDDTGNTRDLLFSKEKSADEIKVGSPLRRSNHVCILSCVDIHEQKADLNI